MKRCVILGISCVALLASSAVMATERVGDPYMLNVCPVSGEELGSMDEVQVYVDDNGRELRFCCKKCVKKYKANPQAFNEKIDKMLIDDQASHYPVKACLKSGGPLDAHDNPDGISFIVGNRLMKTCCTKCKAKVEADPATYLAKLDKLVIEAQRANYKLGACPMAGKALGDSPAEMVLGNRLIKLCCADCKAGVLKDPVAALKKVDTAK